MGSGVVAVGQPKPNAYIVVNPSASSDVFYPDAYGRLYSVNGSGQVQYRNGGNDGANWHYPEGNHINGRGNDGTPNAAVGASSSASSSATSGALSR